METADCGVDEVVKSTTEFKGIRLAHYKAGENIAALWKFDDIVVYANLRCHGHGEFDVMACKAADDDWQILTNGMNFDFGRECDHEVQKLTYEGTQPLLLQLAKVEGIELKSEDDELDYINRLNDLLPNIDLEGPDTFIVNVNLLDMSDNDISFCGRMLGMFTTEFHHDAFCIETNEPMVEAIKGYLRFIHGEDLTKVRQMAVNAVD